MLLLALRAPAFARLGVLLSKPLQLLVTASLLLAPLPLAAQDRAGANVAANLGAEKQAQYRELIEKALQEYALGHWPEARVFFSDAHALWPNARTLRGLGMTCYEERSYVESVGFLEQALENKTQPLTPKLASEAQNILAQAKRFVSSAYFVVTPDNAQLRIDDQPVKTRPNGAVLLDPGDHSLEVSSPGFDSEHRRVRAEAGRELHLTIALHESASPLQLSAAALPTAPTATEPTSNPQAPQRDTFVLQSPAAAGGLAAVGLVGLTTGWVFYGMRDKLRVELWELSLTKAPGFSQARYQDFQNRGSVAVAAASVGAVVMSVAQYFWLPDEEPVPTWAWVAGGVGGAVALGALGWAAFGEHCEISDSLAFCRNTLSDPLFAPMLALQALPLLSLPLMYAIRPRVPLQDAALSFAVAGDAAHSVNVSLSGRF